jgi:transcriptional antiterminator NusG
LRKALVEERLNLPDRLARAEALQRVMRIWLFDRPDTVIGAYWPIKGEFDPLPALHRWKEDGELHGEPQRRQIGLPVVNKQNKTLTFHTWYPGCPMEEDAYGIPKPKDTEVIVPTEEVVEVRRGSKVNTERKFFPGYVLVKMDLTDDSWHLVKNTAKVTGFLGGGGRGKPVPISEAEANRILKQVQEGVERPKPAVSFEIGEQVKVADGPFASFNGTVEDVDEERARVKVAVSIFGRSTPVELDYAQVEKI